jgi:hypothetical protein
MAATTNGTASSGSNLHTLHSSPSPALVTDELLPSPVTLADAKSSGNRQPGTSKYRVKYLATRGCVPADLAR